METVAFWGTLRGGTAIAAEAAIARFGLDHLATLPCRLLSAGQRKRVSLARLLASPAPLWLLDEPTSGLDDASLDALTSIIAEHRAGGGIVIVATHTPVALVETQPLSLADFAPSRRDVASAFGECE